MRLHKEGYMSAKSGATREHDVFLVDFIASCDTLSGLVGNVYVKFEN